MSKTNEKLQELLEWVKFAEGNNEISTNVSELLCAGISRTVEYISCNALKAKIQSLIEESTVENPPTVEASEWRVGDIVLPLFNNCPEYGEIDEIIEDKFIIDWSVGGVVRNEYSKKSLRNIDAELRAKDAEIDRLQSDKKKDQEIAESNNLYCQQLEKRIEELYYPWRTDLENVPKCGREFLIKNDRGEVRICLYGGEEYYFDWDGEFKCKTLNGYKTWMPIPEFKGDNHE